MRLAQGEAHRAQPANIPEWESHRNWKGKLSLDLKHYGLEPADDGGKNIKEGG